MKLYVLFLIFSSGGNFGVAATDLFQSELACEQKAIRLNTEAILLKQAHIEKYVCVDRTNKR